MSHPVSSRRLPGDAPGGGRRPSRRWWWAAAAVVVVVVGGVGLAVFEPWRLFTRSSIDEAAPAAAAAVPAATSTRMPTPPAGSTLVPTAAPGPVPGSAGPTTAGIDTAVATAGPTTSSVEPSATPFVDGEHPTTGTATLLLAPDGRRYLRLQDFSTSDGPDVHVILSDRASGQDDWGVYDDGRHVELGELKATDGNQNYEIPGDVDLSGLQSVVIWCDRFDVAFGSAPLTA